MTDNNSLLQLFKSVIMPYKQTESQEIFKLRTVYAKSTRRSLMCMSFLITESTTYVC